MVNALGRWTIGRVNYILDLSALFWKSLLVFIRRHPYGHKVIFQNTLKQILFTGVNALPVISTVSAALGMVIIIQAYTLLPALGGAQLVAQLLVIVIVRELGPILTAFVVIGRSGTALSTEIGNMRVANEVSALRSMGIDPIRFLIAPRLMGMIVSMVLLGIYFDVIGILGGFIVAQLQIDMTLDVFAQNLLQVLKMEDIYIGLVKNLFSGIAIALVACYHGMEVGRSSTEVPQRTTRAVVGSILFCIFFNALFTAAFYI